MQNKIRIWRKKAKNIQANFAFDLPNYIIDEIIEKENCNDYENLYCLINCAVLNGRISRENADKIKHVYKISTLNL